MKKLFSAVRENKEIFFYAVALLIVFFSYVFLHEKVSLQDVDTAWVISFADNYLNSGIETDTVFRNASSEHLLRFGKIQFFVYGHVLNLIGWTRGNAILISTFFSFMSMFIWFFIIREFGENFHTAAAFSVFMLTLFPLFHSAHMARPEAMVLFMISLSLLLFLKNRFFLSGLTALLAAEIHPMGLLSVFYTGAVIFHSVPFYMKNRKKALKNLSFFMAGIISGLAIFFILHPRMFSMKMIQSVFNESKLIDGHERSYFSYLNMHFSHHPKELVILIFPLLFYWGRQMWRKNALPGIMFITVMVSVFIFRRPNHNYPTYVYPALIFISVFALKELSVLKPAVIGVLIIFMLDVNDIQRTYPRHHTQEILEEVASRVPDDEIPVIALSDYYFVFRNRNYYPVQYRGSWKKENIEECYYIDIKGYNPSIKRILDRKFHRKVLSAFSPVKGKTIRVLYYKRKQQF
ncbi:MAG: hypothetical protein R6W70_10560 [bacterium]